MAGQGGVAHAELEFGATKMGNTDSNLRQMGWVGVRRRGREKGRENR